jgi:chromate reductase
MRKRAASPELAGEATTNAVTCMRAATVLSRSQLEYKARRSSSLIQTPILSAPRTFLLAMIEKARALQLREDNMSDFTVGCFVGSLARSSINRKLANALVRVAPPELAMKEISFGDLPLYSYDYDSDYPQVARDFKAAIAEVDAVLFITPEYNRSIPGGLKNAIDWASRPYGQNAFTRKPSAIIGTSPGAIGTAVGQQHLKSILSFCNSPMMNAVEAYIQFVPALISDQGEVSVASTEDFLRSYMEEFRDFIRRVLTVYPRTT